MAEIQKAKDAFRFYTRLHLSELTGLRARNLTELVELIKTVPESSIYHHTHRFLQQHQYLSPEPPNDFAYWVSNVLGESELGERLASIDTISYSTIESLREKIVGTIEEYIRGTSWIKGGAVHSGDEFHFIKSISFILPTNYQVFDLKEFADVLEKITIDSVYFHIFEARLRQVRGRNDFSEWIENSFGDRATARSISALDPYTYTLEDLRKRLLTIIRKGIKI